MKTWFKELPMGHNILGHIFFLLNVIFIVSFTCLITLLSFACIDLFSMIFRVPV